MKREGRWNEGNTITLIELLKGWLCLWGIFDSYNTKGEKRDSAYIKIAEKSEQQIIEIKTKINNFSAQLGRQR